MFSFLKKIASSIVPGRSDSPTDLHVEEQQILECINNLKKDAEETIENATENIQEKPLGQSDLTQFDVETVKCVHKSGTVTYLCDDYGLIDRVFYFEPNQITACVKIKVNDEVLYSAYKVRDNEAERVYKVYALKNDSWDSEYGAKSVCQSSGEEREEDIPALTRFITGRVTQRQGRKVFVESANIWCNLDEVQSESVPVEGDWVELKAVVSLCEDTADWSGDVLVVKSLKPLLKKTGIGRITLWSSTTKEGAIENLIYFTNESCEDGYAPTLGDEVTYDAVESDQERFKWRAVKVIVNNIKFEHQVGNNNSKKEVSDQFSDKNGISITPAVCTVEVEFNQSKTVTFEVKNNGKVKQLLRSTKFHMRNRSQLSLLSPKEPGPFIIQPERSIVLEFRCKGRYFGLTGEILYFCFENFTMTRRLEINVVSDKKMSELLECKFGTVLRFFNDKRLVKSSVKADTVLCGPRPWKPPKFITRERRCVFNIPKQLWSIAMSTTLSSKNEKSLLAYAPYLKEELNFENYADRFHTLLYLEEIELKLIFKQYDMNGVFLRRSDEYFVLEVPGLAENRPSLVVGDRIVLTQTWVKDAKTKNIGYIHHIQAKEIFVKFHGAFHESYDESECDISFEPNVALLYRSHEAINRGVKNLGADWLFPCAVNEKPPQIDFDVSEDGETFSEQISKFPSGNNPEIVSTCRKKLVWANRKLNGRQKLAVVSVLKGQGRPLPYFIFGPPGTGKTVTLVEIIIQIHRLMPESRILVTSPSNSAADLICERLIEFGKFKPGQLVRLVAQYRVFEGLVPDKLIPYSTFIAGKESAGKNLREGNLRNEIRSSTLGELAGRHRITVATCVTVGALHYAGFPHGHFTHILLDEAGQTSEPEALITTTFQKVCSGQVILAGDPQQLGPVIQSNIARKYDLGVSLLDRLLSRFPYTRDFIGFPHTSGFDPRFITKLKINYRTVPEILSLPSQMFYNSDLIPTVSQTDSVEADIIKKFNFEAEDRETPPAIIFDGVVGQNYQEPDSPSWFNPHEIWQVVFYVRRLYAVGLKDDDIGIVSPYAKQVQKLRNLLSALDLAVPKIGSVEEFQGQERHVIILTTVRSSPKYVKFDIVHSLGFLVSPRRLNVALTRARALLIIVGNPFLLSRDPCWANVIKYCLQNKSYTGCTLDSLGGELKGEGLDEGDAEIEAKDADFDVPC